MSSLNIKKHLYNVTPYLGNTFNNCLNYNRYNIASLTGFKRLSEACVEQTVLPIVKISMEIKHKYKDIIPPKSAYTNHALNVYVTYTVLSSLLITFICY